MKTVMSYNDAKKYVRAFSTVRYVEERPFMIAIVELQDVSSEEAIRSGKPQRLMVAKGLSACSPTDRWDTNRGQDVARGRAEAKLARRIMRMVVTKEKEVKEKEASAGVGTINFSYTSHPTFDGEVYQL